MTFALVKSRKTQWKADRNKLELDLDLVRVDLGRFPQIGVNTRNLLCIRQLCASMIIISRLSKGRYRYLRSRPFPGTAVKG